MIIILITFAHNIAGTIARIGQQGTVCHIAAQTYSIFKYSEFQINTWIVILVII